MHEFVYDTNMLEHNTMRRNVAGNSINVPRPLIRSCSVDIYGHSWYGMDQLIIAFSRLLLEFEYCANLVCHLILWLLFLATRSYAFSEL